jgi:hypothetical protein
MDIFFLILKLPFKVANGKSIMDLNKEDLIKVLEKWSRILKDNQNGFTGPYIANAIGHVDFGLTWPRDHMWEFKGQGWERQEDNGYPIVCYVNLNGQVLFGSDAPEEWREIMIEIDSPEELDKLLTLQWEGDESGVFEDEIPDSVPQELVELRKWYENRFPLD